MEAERPPSEILRAADVSKGVRVNCGAQGLWSLRMAAAAQNDLFEHAERKCSSVAACPRAGGDGKACFIALLPQLIRTAPAVANDLEDRGSLVFFRRRLLSSRFEVTSEQRCLRRKTGVLLPSYGRVGDGSYAPENISITLAVAGNVRVLSALAEEKRKIYAQTNACVTLVVQALRCLLLPVSYLPVQRPLSTRLPTYVERKS